MQSSSSNIIGSGNYISTATAVNLQLVEAVLQQSKVKVTKEEWNIASICALLDRSKVLKEFDVSCEYHALLRLKKSAAMLTIVVAV